MKPDRPPLTLAEIAAFHAAAVERELIVAGVPAAHVAEDLAIGRESLPIGLIGPALVGWMLRRSPDGLWWSAALEEWTEVAVVNPGPAPLALKPIVRGIVGSAAAGCIAGLMKLGLAAAFAAVMLGLCYALGRALAAVIP